jgi:hypothetical protein
MPTKKTQTAPACQKTRFSRTHVSGDCASSGWQQVLRRQFGRDQAFVPENTGTETFFSQFRFGNPQSTPSCREAIDGLCPLGTTSAPAVQIVNFVARRTVE